MNRKIVVNSLAAAVAMACGGSAVALPLSSFNEASATQVTLRVGGSTAHDKGLINMMALTASGSQFCVPGTLDVYTTGTASPGNWMLMTCSSGANSGYGAGSGKTIAILRNGNFGSGAGVSNLVKGTITATDSTGAPVLSNYLDPTNSAVNTTASTINAANGLSAYTLHLNVPTSTLVTALADVGITDEEPKLFQSVFNPALTSTEIAALQVKGISSVIFGVPVSNVLYGRLQALQFATNSSCHPNQFASVTNASTGSVTLTGSNFAEACAPSLSRDTLTALYTGTIADLTSITSANNATETAASVAPYGALADPTLYIARRVATSGTQLASQAFFGGQGCATGSPAHLTSSTARVAMLGSSGNVRSALQTRNSNGQAALGVLSTEINTVAATDFHFIKVNGASPTVLNAVKGSYNFYYESALNYRKSTIGGAAALAGNKKNVADAIATRLGNPASVKLLNASFKLDNTLGTDASQGRGGLLANGVANVAVQPVSPYISTDTATATNDVNARPVATATRGLTGSPNACLNPMSTSASQAGN